MLPGHETDAIEISRRRHCPPHSAIRTGAAPDRLEAIGQPDLKTHGSAMTCGIMI